MVSIDEIGEELASILLKSRQGIYQDTSENRRKHRVGQHYGKESESEVKSDGSGITKKEERLARLEKYKDQLSQIEAKLSAKGISEESRKVGEELKAKMIEKIKKLSARIGVKVEDTEPKPVIPEPVSEPEIREGDLNLSDEELEADLRKFDSYGITLKERKVLAEKYGVAPKMKEIERAIFIQKRFNRFRKTEFTDEDFRDWSKLTDNPTQEKKYNEYANQEPKAFLEALLQRQYNRLVERKLVEKIPYALMSSWNYAMSWSDRHKIMSYLTTKKYLETHTEQALDEKAQRERSFNIIHEKLTEQTQDFKKKFVDGQGDVAAKIYDRAPVLMEKYYKLYKENEEKAQKIRQALQEKGVYRYERDPEWKIVSGAASENYSDYRKNKSILDNFTREAYIEDSRQRATDYFESAMRELSSRFQERGVDAASMTLSNIHDDPKYFSLYVKDKNQNFYARSIWAAEYSEKVTAHLRFIITTRKDKRTND